MDTKQRIAISGSVCTVVTALTLLGYNSLSAQEAMTPADTYDPSVQTLTETLLNPETEEPFDRIPIVFFRIAP